MDTKVYKYFELLVEGKNMIENGSHEFNLVKTIFSSKKGSLSNDEIMVIF